MKIALFGSSLVSAYWNAAANYHRGILRALARRGHRVRFYEPDAYQRQQHRDIDDPDWARVIVYAAEERTALAAVEEAAAWADSLVKCSGVGVLDPLLDRAVLEARHPSTVAFWDGDAPATLDRLAAQPGDPFVALVPRYDLILTWGGGDPVARGYRALGARDCVPVYDALDPETHHPVRPDPRFECDLAYLGDHLPDREARVAEFFLRPAAARPELKLILGGNGWQDQPLPNNVQYIGHVYTREHNALSSTPRGLLNLSRESMARYGFSPPTGIFEAAGAGACLITDAWLGVEQFLEPGRECLVARDGAAVIDHLDALDHARARLLGNAARRRVLSEHTYEHRATQLEALLAGRAIYRRGVG